MTHTLTTPGDREIRVEREFDAPLEQVFATYLDPELIPEWWGPRNTTTIVDKMDVRTGGDWRFIMRDADGQESGFRGTFREIVENERIAQTFEWEGMPGHVSLDVAHFEAIGDRTKVTVISRFHTPEDRDGMLQSGMESGMAETWARLDEVLARVTAR